MTIEDLGKDDLLALARKQGSIINELRSNFTNSVAKECKCKTDISVNHELVNKNLKLMKFIEKASREKSELKEELMSLALEFDEYRNK